MATAVLGRSHPQMDVMGAGGPVQWTLRISILVALLWYPVTHIAAGAGFALQASQAAIYAIVGLSLNVLIGYLGQLSLGHQGFVGAGALFAAYSASVQGFPFFVCLGIGVVTSGLIALLVGLVALRITGLYLSLVTLVFGLTLQATLFAVGFLTNNGAGQPSNRPMWLNNHNDRYFLLCVAFLAVVFYLDRRLTNSKAGRAVAAVKENERVAEAFGVNVTAYKLLAFTFSGATAGLAGALLAFNVQQFNAETYNFQLALTFVIIAVIGGASRVGIIISAIFFAALTPVLNDHGLKHVKSLFGPFQDKVSAFPGLIGALLLIITLVTAPGGLAESLKPVFDWFSGKRFSVHHAKESGPGAVEGSSVRA